MAGIVGSILYNTIFVSRYELAPFRYAISRYISKKKRPYAGSPMNLKYTNVARLTRVEAAFQNLKHSFNSPRYIELNRFKCSRQAPQRLQNRAGSKTVKERKACKRLQSHSFRANIRRIVLHPWNSARRAIYRTLTHHNTERVERYISKVHQINWVVIFKFSPLAG